MGGGGGFSNDFYLPLRGLEEGGRSALCGIIMGWSGGGGVIFPYPSSTAALVKSKVELGREVSK